MANNGKCKKCGGSLVNEHGIRKCLHCGQEPVSVPERHKYLEDHKDEVIADFKKLGATKTALKWRMSSATPTRLLKRWGVVSSNNKGSSNHLPSLPEFSNDWNPEVQLKWLEIWEQESIKQ